MFVEKYPNYKLQPTLDGVVTCTTHAFLQDKSHSAVTKAGQKTAQKRKDLAGAFAGALYKAFERQAVRYERYKRCGSPSFQR